MTTKTRRALYTVSAAALLLAAAPALADGDAGAKHECGRCSCARMIEHPRAPAPDARADTARPAPAGDRDAAFLREVWSAP